MPFVEKPFKYKHVYKRKPLKTKKRQEEEEEELIEGRLGHVATSRSSWSSTYCSTPEFLDNSYWRRQAVCCGVVYVGRLGEMMMDQRLYSPCSKSGKHDLTLSPPTTLAEASGASSLLEPSPSSSSSSSTHPPSPSSSTSAFSSSITPSSIESLVESELQAFQVFEAFIISSHCLTQLITTV